MNATALSGNSVDLENSEHRSHGRDAPCSLKRGADGALKTVVFGLAINCHSPCQRFELGLGFLDFQALLLLFMDGLLEDGGVVVGVFVHFVAFHGDHCI